MSDPYKEFAMEYVDYLPGYGRGYAGISIEFPLSTVRVMLTFVIKNLKILGLPFVLPQID